MPAIILRIPSVRIQVSHEFNNGSQYRLHSMDTHSTDSENKEDEGYANHIDEEIDEDIIEIVINDDIKQEELRVEEIRQVELEIEKLKQKIKEEMMLFQYSINEHIILTNAYFVTRLSRLYPKWS